MEVAVAATEPRGVVQSEEPELTAPPEQRVGKRTRLLPRVHVRADLGVDEPAHEAAQLVVVGGEHWMTHTGRNGATWPAAS